MNKENTVTAFYTGKMLHPHYGNIEKIQQRLISVDNNIFQQPDFLTWLFPWVEMVDDSAAPLLTHSDLEQFRNQYELRRTFNRSLQIILSYYGMQLRAEAVQASDTFAQVADLWLFNPDITNQQRLTQIIRSITLLGEKHLAETLFQVLSRTQQAFPKNITPKLLQEWQHAIVEGEKQFYSLFTQTPYNYKQFWETLENANKTIALKQLVFTHAKNAQALIDLLTTKGFHSTHVSEDIYTLKLYTIHAHSVVYLTPGQLAMIETLNFELSNQQTFTGKEIIARLLN